MGLPTIYAGFSLLCIWLAEMVSRCSRALQHCLAFKFYYVLVLIYLLKVVHETCMDPRPTIMYLFEKTHFSRLPLT
jgi:hypothetical protein